MRMDHHCPWVGNCVGANTHKYFWNFLFYAFLGTVQAATLMIWSRGLKLMTEDVGFMIAAIICLAFSLSIGGLLGIHTYMLMHNMTTLEMAGLSDRNPFHMGSYRENWAQTFGYKWQTWFVPVPPEDKTYEAFNTQVKPSF